MNGNQQLDVNDDLPPTPEQHEEFQAHFREQEQLRRRERLIKQMLTEEQEKEAQAYREYSIRRMAERRVQMEMDEARDKARNQKPSQNVDPIDVCGGSGDGNGNTPLRNSSGSVLGGERFKMRSKLRFPIIAYPIAPDEYDLWLSNLNVWLSTQDPSASWATAVYLELPKQMQRMIAQMPGLQNHLAETKLRDSNLDRTNRRHVQ